MNKEYMLITKEIEIDMAHRVPNHKSKCRNLHGHRYKIEVGVNDKVIIERGQSDEGMVIDFSDLKGVMIQELDERFDHGSIFYNKDTYGCYIQSISEDYQNEQKMHLVNFIPTAENLAKYWFELIQIPLKEKGIKLAHVKIWETPTSTAIYTIEDQNNLQ